MERETDINFVSWIAEIQFPLNSFFSVSFSFGLFIFILKKDKRSPRGLNPCARIVPHKKQPADYRATCAIYMGTNLF